MTLSATMTPIRCRDRLGTRCIDALFFLGWVLLPYTHVRWLPPLGQARPISALPFLLATALVVLTGIPWAEIRLRSPSSWRRLLEPFRTLPAWSHLQWWLVLLAMGLVSMLITPFYGSVFQAANRLLAYMLIFMYLFAGAYSLRVHGLERVALWIGIGSLPALAYAGVEAGAMGGVGWAKDLVRLMRNHFIVDYPWYDRMCLFATEPSFCSFQMLLWMAILPFLKHRVWRTALLVLMTLVLVFTASAMVLILMQVYWVARLALRMSARARWRALAGMAVVVVTLWGVAQHPSVQRRVAATGDALVEIERVCDLKGSSSIRGSYMLNLVYALIETRGLGLGIGQYGLFWKDIYRRHIDYPPIDYRGEITRTLESPAYMRPWSVVLGVAVDLGLAGFAVFLIFAARLLRGVRSQHGMAMAAACFVAFLGAYPIVIPHLWLALALVGGMPQSPPPAVSPPVAATP